MSDSSSVLDRDLGTSEPVHAGQQYSVDIRGLLSVERPDTAPDHRPPTMNSHRNGATWWYREISAGNNLRVSTVCVRNAMSLAELAEKNGKFPILVHFS
jgi:hypothetical protein